MVQIKLDSVKWKENPKEGSNNFNGDEIYTSPVYTYLQEHIELMIIPDNWQKTENPVSIMVRLNLFGIIEQT